LEPIDRRMLRQIERRLNQPLEVRSIPSRAEVEARRLEKLQSQIRETLAGERMASFLPIVRELSEEYDPQAIAAAALQIVYDQDCPNWMKGDWQVPNPESFNKPMPRRKFSKSNNRQSDRKPIAQKF
jgi:ATP-dependent RNA helicase DeaD